MARAPDVAFKRGDLTSTTGWGTHQPGGVSLIIVGVVRGKTVPWYIPFSNLYQNSQTMRVSRLFTNNVVVRSTKKYTKRKLTKFSLYDRMLYSASW